MLQTLQECLPGFEWHWKILNSVDWQVPQLRNRLYIVGLRVSRQVQPFGWPSPCTMRRSLSSVLPSPVSLSLEEKNDILSRMSRTNRRNLAAALEDLDRRGFDHSRETYAIDIDTGRRNKLWSFPQARCLTKSRGQQGGPFLSNHFRRTSLAELACLQGLRLSNYDLAGLSESQVGGMCLALLQNFCFRVRCGTWFSSV